MKFLICSCSHGHLMDDDACNELLEFKKAYEPDITAHLGDFLDMSAFMARGAGTDTDADRIHHDIQRGFDFLHRLSPQLIMCGNHEDRLWKLKESNKELVRYAAQDCIDKIYSMSRRLGAELVEYGGMRDPESYRLIGPIAVGHGWSFGQYSEREHAFMTGKPTVIGHVHRLQMIPAHSFGAPPGWSCGCLCDIPKMGYAKNRKATSAWANGCVYGEYRGENFEVFLKRMKQWTEKATTIPSLKVS